MIELQRYLANARYVIANLIATGDKHEHLYEAHYQLMLVSIDAHTRLRQLQQSGPMFENQQEITSTYYYCNDLAAMSLHAGILLKHEDVLLSVGNTHEALAEIFSSILAQ